jgi:hypothetical protein
MEIQPIVNKPALIMSSVSKTEREEKAERVQQIINHSTGTYRYQRISPMLRSLVVTDGVAEVFEAAGAFWLGDIVMSLFFNKKIKRQIQRAQAEEDYLVCKLKVDVEEGKGEFTMRRMDEKEIIYKQKISYTDFPLEEFEMWLDVYSHQNGEEPIKILFLPSER